METVITVSDAFVIFPYAMVQKKSNLLTIFVPTYEDESAIEIQRLTFEVVRVKKYVSNFDENNDTENGQIVYWNVIVPIKTFSKISNTYVFNVVFSDNLYNIPNAHIDVVDSINMRCPLQINYNPTKMVYLEGECAGLSQTRDIIKNNSQFLIVFNKNTPMGVKILNTKRLLILMGLLNKNSQFHIYLPPEEIMNIHKELSWEMTRRRMRTRVANRCTVLNEASYRYVLSAIELLGIDANGKLALHTIVEKFTSLIHSFKLVPDIFVELNRLHGEEKHVRLYCEYDSVAVTNAGIVPLNLPTVNPRNDFSITPCGIHQHFHQDVGSYRMKLHSPRYNYFL
ncbi:hypothetical protein [Phthorimaea operculella granulovirus]|uniref:ODV-EC43 n=1 Tax=Phthorimaea operculella granulovirus TaxID=192584 RepID=Q8JS09_9BBAC|nr:hypothetical protein [Phthorimaea operculella granulovirus]AAM70248.1 hypothetical protein [Phthorimaea operculella granulovirus]ANY57439.1 hypothetical protein PhopGVgp050 [Phthorimaea operculella granulovirus]QBH65885.1 hypothetical protein PhopGVgp050 [Phthorimaea operculella granulovirus]QBH66015.1 hypothetical protein PhopGVgp050 [Phthorimaea operculella granulovirus]QBH66145.1 hypothetical protein PhopGVgp050 [Phthorimaea operculella granulovirus]